MTHTQLATRKSAVLTAYHVDQRQHRAQPCCHSDTPLRKSPRGRGGTIENTRREVTDTAQGASDVCRNTNPPRLLPMTMSTR